MHGELPTGVEAAEVPGVSGLIAKELEGDLDGVDETNAGAAG